MQVLILPISFIAIQQRQILLEVRLPKRRMAGTKKKISQVILTTYDNVRTEVEVGANSQELSILNRQDILPLSELSSDVSEDGEGDLVFQIDDKGDLNSNADKRIDDPQALSNIRGSETVCPEGLPLSIKMEESEGGVIKAENTHPKSLILPWRKHVQGGGSGETPFPLLSIISSSRTLLAPPSNFRNDEGAQVEEINDSSREKGDFSLTIEEELDVDKEDSSDDSQGEPCDLDEEFTEAYKQTAEITPHPEQHPGSIDQLTRRHINPHVTPSFQKNKQVKELYHSTQLNPLVLGMCAIGIPLVFILGRYYGDKL